MAIFTPVERMLALRYMRSRRSEGFISVIAWFSLFGDCSWGGDTDHCHVGDERF